jgi:hypothetical protein
LEMRQQGIGLYRAMRHPPSSRAGNTIPFGEPLRCVPIALVGPVAAAAHGCGGARRKRTMINAWPSILANRPVLAKLIGIIQPLIRKEGTLLLEKKK